MRRSLEYARDDSVLLFKIRISFLLIVYTLQVATLNLMAERRKGHLQKADALSVLNYFKDSSTATATETVVPTIGLLPVAPIFQNIRNYEAIVVVALVFFAVFCFEHILQ